MKRREKAEEVHRIFRAVLKFLRFDPMVKPHEDRMVKGAVTPNATGGALG